MHTDSPTPGVLTPTVDADTKPQTPSAPFLYARPEAEPKPLVGSCHIFAVGEDRA
jgi:hypothetical protein